MLRSGSLPATAAAWRTHLSEADRHRLPPSWQYRSSKGHLMWRLRMLRASTIYMMSVRMSIGITVPVPGNQRWHEGGSGHAPQFMRDRGERMIANTAFEGAPVGRRPIRRACHRVTWSRVPSTTLGSRRGSAIWLADRSTDVLSPTLAGAVRESLAAKASSTVQIQQSGGLFSGASPGLSQRLRRMHIVRVSDSWVPSWTASRASLPFPDEGEEEPSRREPFESA